MFMWLRLQLINLQPQNESRIHVEDIASQLPSTNINQEVLPQPTSYHIQIKLTTHKIMELQANSPWLVGSCRTAIISKQAYLEPNVFKDEMSW